MENKNNNVFVAQSQSVSAPCFTCVWGYVYGCKPTKNCCGKFSRKPNKVYFDGVSCPRYQKLEK